MAKQKPTSRAARRTAAQKKSPARKTARKTAAKSTARKKLKAKGREVPPKKRARPKQRIAISHHRDEDFKADGLRTYAKYRDLGIAEASQGLARAHVIRLIGPCNPAEVSKLHFHDVDFQMVYVLKGWVKTYMEGQGETLMQEGSAWTQPPRIRHLIMDYSDDVELAGSDPARGVQDGRTRGMMRARLNALRFVPDLLVSGSGGIAIVRRDYREDIDWLRAIAVLAVVAFHFEAPAVFGGFVGVDIFFVISGYLITGIIAVRSARAATFPSRNSTSGGCAACCPRSTRWWR